MITIATIIAFLSKAKPIIDWLKDYWRETLETALVLVVINCCMSHCGGARYVGWEQGAVTDTIFVHDTTTHWLKPDSIPYPVIVEVPGEVIWRDSPPDTLKVPSSINFWLRRQIALCDSAYRYDLSIRSYRDTLETDSFRLTYALKTIGELLEPPLFGITNLTPTPHITTTIEVPPQRGLYLEGAVGPVFAYGKPTKFETVGGSLGLGVYNRKNWEYGMRVGADQFNWNIQATVRKKFSLSKK